MATATFMDKQQKYLLKKFHTKCGAAGLDAIAKRAMVESCGVESSRDLSVHDLIALCDAIDRLQNKKADEMDKWRKRVLGVLFSWFRAIGKPTNDINLVKGVACRATGAKSFNDIPLERLRSIYYAFSKKIKDLEFAEKLTADELDLSAWMN